VWLTPHLRDPQPEGEREMSGYAEGENSNYYTKSPRGKKDLEQGVTSRR